MQNSGSYDPIDGHDWASAAIPDTLILWEKLAHAHLGFKYTYFLPTATAFFLFGPFLNRLNCENTELNMIVTERQPYVIYFKAGTEPKLLTA